MDLNKHTDATFKDQYPRAAKIHSQNNTHESVMSLIIGRQILVIFTVFIAAQLTGMPNMKNFPWTDKEFPHLFREILLGPGVLGGVITVIFAQLTSQMLATNYPVQFLNVPGIWIVVLFCKIFDWIGLVHITWIIADLFCRALRLDDSVSVRLAEYDAQTHKSNASIEFLSVPEDKTSKSKLSPDNIDYVPQQALLIQLIEALKTKPEYHQHVKNILFRGSAH